MHPYIHKPLPDYEKASSDVSSLAPSLSASQVGVAPPGAVTEPSWRSTSPHVARSPKPYTHGTTQPTVFEETGGSSAEEEEEERPVVEYENPRFSRARARPRANCSLPSSAVDPVCTLQSCVFVQIKNRKADGPFAFYR